MRNHKNKKLKKFVAFSALVSSCCIFSPSKDSKALMKLLRGIRGGFNLTSRNLNSNTTTVAGVSNSGGKFTPLSFTAPNSSSPQQPIPKINSDISTHTSNGKKLNKPKSSSAIKLEAKIITTQSSIELNRGYKTVLEDGIRNSKNPRVQQLLYMDLMSTSTSIGDLEYRNKKLQNQLTKIKNNN